MSSHMADRNESEHQIEYIAERDQNYRVISANACWVAVTPRGDIKIDFMIEYPVIPQRIVHSVTKDGGLGEILEVDPRATVENKSVATRRFQGAVVLSVKEARSLAELILNSIEKWVKVDDAKSG